jgi:hypothetical protein
MDRHRPGTTLTELAIALVLIGVLATLVLVPFGRLLDRLAVAGARDAVAARVAQARVLAPTHGSARVVVEPGSGAVRVEAPIGSPASAGVDLTAWGVAVAADGHAAIELDFDGLGLGRMANRTLVFRRGAAEARLSLSIYGRPRRW